MLIFTIKNTDSNQSNLSLCELHQIGPRLSMNFSFH